MTEPDVLDGMPTDLQQTVLAARWVPVYRPDDGTWNVSAHPTTETWAMPLTANLPEALARHIADVHNASLEAAR